MTEPFSASSAPVDAAERIIEAFGEVMAKRRTFSSFQHLARDVGLAHKAMPGGYVRLIGHIERLIQGQSYPGTFFMAYAMLQHASALDDVGRQTEALALLDATPVDIFMPDRIPDAEIDFRRLNVNASIQYFTVRAVTLMNLKRFGESLTTSEMLLRGLATGAWPYLDDQDTSRLRAQTLLNCGHCLAELGQFDEANGAFEKGLANCESWRDGPQKLLARAQFLGNMGNVAGGLGQEDKALYYYSTAIDLLADMTEAKAQHSRAKLHCLNGILLREGEGKRFDDAEREFGAALTLLQSLAADGDDMYSMDIVRVHVNRGNLFAKRQYWQLALGEFASVTPELFVGEERRAFHTAYAIALSAVARPEQAMEQLALARRAFREGRRQAGVDDRSIGYVGRLAFFFHLTVTEPLDQGRIFEAFEAVQDAKATVLGDLHDRLLRFPLTVPTLVLNERRRVVDWLRQTHEGSEPDPSLPRTSLSPPQQAWREWRAELERRTGVYISEWRIHLEGERWTHDLGKPELSRVKAIHREQSVRELDGRENDRTVSLASIRDALPNDWAVLDFWRTDEETVHVFFVSQNEFQAKCLKMPFNDARLRKALDELREDTLRVGTLNTPPRSWNPALSFLGHFLFEPLRPLLEPLRGLYLVPHGELHFYPLHACNWTEGGRPVHLCDRFEVVYLPSASMLPHLSSVRPIVTALSLANPERCTDNTLPFSEWEAAEVSQRLPMMGIRKATGPEAVFAATNDWGDADLVHFTCHGLGDEGFAPLSHLRLADDLLLAHDVMYRRDPLRDGALVVLNGCQTGVRDRRALDEGLGLMTAFLLRGASLVLATRWCVSDLYAAEVVIGFLERVVKGRKSSALALREAQKAARTITAERVLQRCEEGRERFPAEAFPQEAKKIELTAALTSWRLGRKQDAQHFAGRAAVIMRHLRQHAQAEYVQSFVQEAPPFDPQQVKQALFEHPVYWSAFELIGRAT
jgi:CHAT domain-containing protein/tetratricopeptide (TPR) repeat protein